MAKESKNTYKIAVLIISVIVIAAITFIAGRPLVRFASDPEAFRSFVDSHGIWGRLFFMLTVICQVILALIPGEPFEIAAGYAFGTVEGTLLCLIGCTLGSMLVFFGVRKFGIKAVRVFFPEEKLARLKFLKNDKKRTLLFLIVFMIPGTPKDLLSYFAGLTDINTAQWLIICSLGRIPSIITSTVGGDAIGEKNYIFAGVIFALTLIISGLGLLIYNKICDRKNGERKR